MTPEYNAESEWLMRFSRNFLFKNNGVKAIYTVSSFIAPKRPASKHNLLILDTDHLSYLEWGGENASNLREKLALVNSQSYRIATTIINYEEQMRGWMSYIANTRSKSGELEAYQRLERHLNSYKEITVLNFDEFASQEFSKLRSLNVKIGAMDMKIAAIVLSYGVNCTLLSKNSGDFHKVPNIRVEDWITWINTVSGDAIS